MRQSGIISSYKIYEILGLKNMVLEALKLIKFKSFKISVVSFKKILNRECYKIKT